MFILIWIHILSLIDVIMTICPGINPWMVVFEAEALYLP